MSREIIKAQKSDPSDGSQPRNTTPRGPDLWISWTLAGHRPPQLRNPSLVEFGVRSLLGERRRPLRPEGERGRTEKYPWAFRLMVSVPPPPASPLSCFIVDTPRFLDRVRDYSRWTVSWPSVLQRYKVRMIIRGCTIHSPPNTKVKDLITWFGRGICKRVSPSPGRRRTR